MEDKNLEFILNPIKLQELARSWINEDLTNFDVQGLVVGDKNITTKIYLKEPAVLAGRPFVDSVFKELGISSPQWLFPEGFYLKDASQQNKIAVAIVIGPARFVLIAERTILNVLSRCSGIATRCYYIRDKLDKIGWHGELVGTRKTTPGFRMVEKYGLLVGQAGTHRYDLSSMVMFKDNHWKILSNQMGQAIRKTKQVFGFSTKIEVECSCYQDAEVAANAGADIIMLDNVSVGDSKKISSTIKEKYPNLLIEVSGGINEENFIQYAAKEFDIISMSCLVQGCPSIDYSFKISTAQDILPDE